ncbi:CheY-like chemotaxis protein [Paucibacter oligotrophus]|uniref:CheY-like chemotaxis protein n=1 Tax=Roseateles oligotrophus TaxID=1769250 RepID=A0A840LAD9_9BURK|nr:response regulator [Roseateles oligotrophus]MBB4843158.1 CheY-like chemotaxis protein [Roseateles oligotrophus]
MASKILVIEDQAEIRRLICWSLAETDHQVQEAPNGSLGLAMAQAIRPDLIYLDVMMPGEIDGIEVCRQLRQDPATAAILIVILSADASQDNKARALAAGANFFLPKPFSPAKLLELTELLLRNKVKAPEDPEAP